jgi:ribosomal subunit interface protein
VELKISGRHAALTPAARSYTEEKLGGLAKYNRAARLLEVVFDDAKKLVRVEGKAHVGKGAPLVLHAEHTTAEGAVDRLHDLLERAMRQKKERVRDRARGRHHGGAPGAGELAAGAAAGAAAAASPKTGASEEE